VRFRKERGKRRKKKGLVPRNWLVRARPHSEGGKKEGENPKGGRGREREKRGGRPLSCSLNPKIHGGERKGGKRKSRKELPSQRTAHFFKGSRWLAPRTPRSGREEKGKRGGGGGTDNDSGFLFCRVRAYRPFGRTGDREEEGGEEKKEPGAQRGLFAMALSRRSRQRDCNRCASANQY